MWKERVDIIEEVESKGIVIKGKLDLDEYRAVILKGISDAQKGKKIMSALMGAITKDRIEELIQKKIDPKKLAIYILAKYEDVVAIIYSIFTQSDKVKKVFGEWSIAVKDYVNELVLLNNANLFNRQLYTYLVYENPMALRYVVEVLYYMRMELLKYEYANFLSEFQKVREIQAKLRANKML